MDTTLNYWHLRCKVLEIKVCRVCGIPLDAKYKKRKHGLICKICYKIQKSIY